MRYLVISLITVALLAGCASKKSADVHPDLDRYGQAGQGDLNYSGFLGGDYSKLKPAHEGDVGVMVYRNPSANWASYSSMMIDPVTFWRGEKSKMDGLDPEEVQTLVNYFHAAFREQLGKDFPIVTSRKPGTLRLQVAVVKAEDTSVALDTVSTFIPIGRVVSEGKGLLTSRPGMVGALGIEIRVTDAATGKLLAAAVDERYGRKGYGRISDSWGDAKDLMDFYALMAKFRICRLQGRTGCLEPTA